MPDYDVNHPPIKNNPISSALPVLMSLDSKPSMIIT
jgi:hypothetical protein